MRNPRATGRAANDISGATVAKTGGTLESWKARRPRRKKPAPERSRTFRKSEALRLRIYYRARHGELIRALGGKCERCGVRTKLSIRHYKQADWQPDKLSSHCRIARYWREHEEGVDLILLCLSCNGKDKKVRS